MNAMKHPHLYYIRQDFRPLLDKHVCVLLYVASMNSAIMYLNEPGQAL